MFVKWTIQQKWEEEKEIAASQTGFKNAKFFDYDFSFFVFDCPRFLTFCSH